MPLDVPFTRSGDLPAGIHRATLQEVLARFASTTPRRAVLGDRLRRVYRAAGSTRYLARLIVFGSFVSAAAAPNDVDVFLVMEDAFDASSLSGDALLVFDHSAAQTALGASVFWMRRVAVDAMGDDMAVGHW